MKVTEQIDALRAMGINPVRYLVVPRVLAAIVMLPIVTIFADVVAIFGGYVVSTLTLDVSGHTFASGLKMFFYLKDLFSGLIKALFFGGIIGTMGCYYGSAPRAAPRGWARRPPGRWSPRACWC